MTCRRLSTCRTSNAGAPLPIRIRVPPFLYASSWVSNRVVEVRPDFGSGQTKLIAKGSGNSRALGILGWVTGGGRDMGARAGFCRAG
jgi:hypothetical protein